MKKQIISVMVALFLPLSSQAAFNELDESKNSLTTQPYGEKFWSPNEAVIDPSKEETQGALPSPAEIDQIYKTFGEIGILLRFPQTKWNECSDNPTGNYYTIGCSTSRGISQILDSYLSTYIYQCIDAGLEAQGGGRAQAVHIVHAGITADPRHSPKSLHSENRAIDIKQIKVKLSNGTDRQFTYALSGNRPFYTALRNCWGGVVNRNNTCPLIEGGTLKTGSIGWENKDHGAHMHLSVPYCINGRYSSSYFQR